MDEADKSLLISVTVNKNEIGPNMFLAQKV